MNASAAQGYDHLSNSDFKLLAEFIEAYCGIRMPPAKKTLVEGRLRRRVRALGLSSLGEYCRFLFEGDGLRSETVQLIDAVTTNKTDFFREPDHFQMLTERVMPELLKRPDRPGLDRPLSVWSAAASTGAEAYTLAMVLDEFSQRTRGIRFSILATDICTDVLEQAKLAIYPEDMLTPVPAQFRHRYFMRSRDAESAKVRVAPAIRQMVRFGRLNLMDATYPLEQMDVIFCRNILIYFDKDIQQAVLSRLCQHLRPGGYLFLGHAETVTGMKLPLRQVVTSLFIRK